jgi:hypothetical protein
VSSDWIRDLFEEVIARQGEVLPMFSSVKIAEASGRAASLWIDWEGQNGWRIVKYDLWLSLDNGIQWKPPEVQLRNAIWMTEITFRRLILERIEPEQARMHGEIKIAGESSLYDGLEMIQTFKQIRASLLRPSAEKAGVAEVDSEEG